MRLQLELQKSIHFYQMKKKLVLSRQLLRCETLIGANIEVAIEG